MYQIIERILREADAAATDNQIHHQMEYLRIQVDHAHRVTVVGDHGGSATFLGRFAGRDEELIGRMTEALQEHVDAVSKALLATLQPAVESLRSSNIMPEQIWLSRRRHPFRPRYIWGIPVLYHDHEEEFVTAPTYGRMISIG